MNKDINITSLRNNIPVPHLHNSKIDFDKKIITLDDQEVSFKNIVYVMNDLYQKIETVKGSYTPDVAVFNLAKKILYMDSTYRNLDVIELLKNFQSWPDYMEMDITSSGIDENLFMAVLKLYEIEEKNAELLIQLENNKKLAGNLTMEGSLVNYLYENLPEVKTDSTDFRLGK